MVKSEDDSNIMDNKLTKYRIEALETTQNRICKQIEKLADQISKNTLEIALMKLKMVMFSTIGGFLGSGLVMLLIMILKKYNGG